MKRSSETTPDRQKIDTEGHVAHTQAADSQRGLAGEMHGPIKLKHNGQLLASVAAECGCVT